MAGLRNGGSGLMNQTVRQDWLGERMAEEGRKSVLVLIYKKKGDV